MTKQEFDRIVKDSVAAGAKRAEAEDYVVRGYKIPTDAKGNPVFDELKSKNSKGKK